MFRFCLFLAVIVAATFAEDCTEQVNKYNECVNKKREEQKEASQANREKMIAEGLECFKTNQCKEPTLDDVEDSTPSPKDGKAKGRFNNRNGNGFRGANGHVRNQCYKQIAEKAKQDVEKCVQKKEPTFQFPAKGKRGNEKRKGSRPQGFNYGNLARNINDSCPTEPQREKTKVCLQDTFQKRTSANPEDRRKKAEERFNQTCQNKEECYKQISQACQTQLNQTKKEVCDCARQEYLAKKADFEQEYNTCSGTTNAPQAAAKSQGPPSKSAQYTGSGLEFFVSSMCNQRDPCERGFKPRGEGGKGKGKGKGQ